MARVAISSWLEDIFAIGNLKESTARVREHLEAGADHVVLQLMSADIEGMTEGLGRLAPELLD
jgi:hypothetical protein